MKNKCVIVAVVLLIIAGAGGYYFGAAAAANRYANEISRYQRAIDSVFPPLPEEIFSIDGSIKEIGDGYLTIETHSLSKRVLPGEEPIMEERKIIVSEDTETIKRSPMVFEFSEEEGTEVPVVKEEKYSLSELKTGDYVIVEADENIKNETEFVAAKIIMEEIDIFPFTEE